MKKLICLLIVLILVFAGCGRHPNSGTTDITTAPTGDHAGTVSHIPDQEPMYAAAVPAKSEAVTAEDGTVIFTYTHQNLMLTLPDPDVADKIIIDFLGRMDSTRTTADATLASAKAAYSASASWVPYLYSITYSPTRMDQGVLSLFGSNVIYSGTSHPERVCVSANYDLVTGDVLTLGSIMSVQASTEDFCRLTLETLAKMKESKYLYEGYEAAVRQRFQRDESQDQDWYFTQTGLCFYFAPYEIAGYASGVIVAEIPYEKLTGLLYNGYFPAERHTTDSAVQVSRFDEIDPDDFTQIAETIIDPDGEMVFLYTDGLVWDVQIQVGTLDAGRTAFSEIYTALFSHTLSPGDAIMVQTLFSDTTNVIRLTYNTNTGTVTRYLSRNESNGAILLTEK